MPLDSHDGQDDDMGRLCRYAELLDVAYQPPSFGKFNDTSHATPLPDGHMGAFAQAMSHRITQHDD